MNLFHNVLALGLAGAVLVAGPARRASAGQYTAASAASHTDDSTLKARIGATLKKNAAMAARDIDVDVHEGIVTLKGTVRSAGEKARATRLATIKGVTAVRNELVVDAPAATRRARTATDATGHAGEQGVDVAKGAAQKVGETTKEIAGATANKTKEIVATTGGAITDGWITTKMKTKFFDETLLKDSDIHVETDDHVVTLKGTVASSAARARAVAIASGTDGVARVVDQLVVKEQ